MDIAMHNGYCRFTKEMVGKEVGDVTKMETFEEVKAAIFEEIRHLMRMANDNFFWGKNNGFTLAIDGSNDNVVVHDRRHAGWFIDADAFAAYLENCIDVVTEWR